LLENMRKFSVLLILAAGFAMAQTAVDLDSDPVNRVASKLSCQCGCSQNMACKMEPGCSQCKRAKTKIFAEQAAGKSDSQILDEFVAEDGRKILAITPGLFGTAGPFVVLLLGGVVVLFAIRKYMKPHSAGNAPEIDPEVMERINKDMAKFD
jgi:cytochrome c-type biogenesis protein CcmH/NrfF